MPSGGKRGRDDDGAAGMDSFFEEVSKSEEGAVKNKKKKVTEAFGDMNTFFSQVNQSQKAALKKQVKEGLKPAASVVTMAPPQSSNEREKPVVAAHHAPLDFDDVTLPPDPVPISIAHTPSVTTVGGGSAVGSAVVAGIATESSSRAVGGVVPVRVAAGKQWKDESLLEWPENDYRLFVGNLDKEAKLEQVEKAFSQYSSFAKAKLVMNNFKEPGTNRFMCKGYGFVSFLDPMECAKALRTENGKYCGLRPMQLKKSNWESRNKGEQKKAQMVAKTRGF